MRIEVRGGTERCEIIADGQVVMELWRPTGGGYVRNKLRRPDSIELQVSEALEYVAQKWLVAADGDLTGIVSRLVKRPEVRQIIEEMRIMCQGV